MKYYKALEEKHDYFTGYTTVKNELVTEKERNTKFPHIMEQHFQPVEISKKKIYFCFGCRFEIGQGANH